MWQGIKTFVWVTFITGLIWLYAESEVVKRHEMELDLKFVPAPGHPLQVEPSTPERVRLVYNSTTAISAELDRLTRGAPVVLQISDDPSKPDGLRDVSLRDLLALTPPFKDRGLNIVEVRPPSVSIDVEHLNTKKVPVVPIVDGVDHGPITLDPSDAEVEVTAPADVAARWDKNLKLEARPDAGAVARLDATTPQTIEATLDLPAAYRDPRVKLAKTTVHITLTVRKKTASITIHGVPIKTNLPPAETALVSVKLDDDQAVLHDVALTGPIDVIDRIRKGEIKVYAYLDLTADELEKDAGKDGATAPPVVVLPPGVTLDTPPASVRFRVTKKIQP